MENLPKRGGVVISPNIVREREFVDPQTGNIINNPKEKKVIRKANEGVIPLGKNTEDE